jgi:hypothetical protein
MPRFYFHVLDGSATTDETGTELPNIDAAKTEAVKLASGILREVVPERIWQGSGWQIVVTDNASAEGGHTVLTLTISAQQ